MDSDPSVALPLLQLGLLMGIVIVGHGFATRRMPVEIIPGFLQPGSPCATSSGPGSAQQPS